MAWRRIFSFGSFAFRSPLLASSRSRDGWRQREAEGEGEQYGDNKSSGVTDGALDTFDLHFNISPVFVYHKSRSSSSKSISMRSEKSFSFSSRPRYLFLVEGGLGLSMTPNSVSRANMCLSRIAYPRKPTLRRKWLASLYPSPRTPGFAAKNLVARRASQTLRAALSSAGRNVRADIRAFQTCKRRARRASGAYGRARAEYPGASRSSKRAGRFRPSAAPCARSRLPCRCKRRVPQTAFDQRRCALSLQTQPALI